MPTLALPGRTQMLGCRTWAPKLGSGAGYIFHGSVLEHMKYGLCSYDPYSNGMYTYGPYDHGLHRYGRPSRVCPRGYVTFQNHYPLLHASYWGTAVLSLLGLIFIYWETQSRVMFRFLCTVPGIQIVLAV